jgi:hypothetical protein
MAVLTEPIRVPISDETNLREKISPFDVPKTMIASYDENADTFEIVFRYISTEELKTLISPDGLKLSFGKNSHRIYSLSLADAKKHSLQLEHFLLNALSVLTSNLSASISQQERPSANFKIIRSLISENSSILTQYLNSTIRACA